MSGGKRVLILFALEYLDRMLRKGNVWYVRHYEDYFDRVYVVYLFGGPTGLVRRGKTVLISAGSSKRFLNLVFAPIKLLCLSRRIRATHYLTADLVFSWWTACLCRWQLSAKIRLLPVNMPEQYFISNGQSVSGLPMPLERLLMRASYLSAYRILSTEYCSQWLKDDPITHRKLVTYEKDPESLPTQEFFSSIEVARLTRDAMFDPTEFNLLYVGRLHTSKFVNEVIGMMGLLQDTGGLSKVVRLHLIGDGPERHALEDLARSLGVGKYISFLGGVPNSELPKYFLSADLFISTVTGTSLREAALCGTPVLAYDLDWVSEALRHGETAYLVPRHDVPALASGVRELLCNPMVLAKLSKEIAALAWQLWSPNEMSRSLRQAFDE
jgi:glycosyltransferase involved in cell wall biosynthesis